LDILLFLKKCLFWIFIQLLSKFVGTYLLHPVLNIDQNFVDCSIFIHIATELRVTKK